jgi:hypothetical protein
VQSSYDKPQPIWLHSFDIDDKETQACDSFSGVICTQEALIFGFFRIPSSNSCSPAMKKTAL